MWYLGSEILFNFQYRIKEKKEKHCQNIVKTYLSKIVFFLLLIAAIQKSTNLNNPFHERIILNFIKLLT